ncbi:4-hydroxy-3-methylbut-2-enyl diphosphatereductase, partial [Striga asiatica]
TYSFSESSQTARTSGYRTSTIEGVDDSNGVNTRVRDRYQGKAVPRSHGIREDDMRRDAHVKSSDQLWKTPLEESYELHTRVSITDQTMSYMNRKVQPESTSS